MLLGRVCDTLGIAGNPANFPACRSHTRLHYSNSRSSYLRTLASLRQLRETSLVAMSRIGYDEWARCAEKEHPRYVRGHF